VIGAAVKVMRIATGEESEDYGPAPESEGKDRAAVALGKKGGLARAKKLTAEQRRAVSEKAAKTRWGKSKI